MPINTNSRYRGLSDISMRHSDTIVGYVMSDGTVTPYVVRGVEGSHSNPELVLHKLTRDHSGPESRVVGINHPDLLLDRPDCGFANLRWEGKTFAVFYSTRALRQYKRSLVMNQLQVKLVGNPRCQLRTNGNNQAIAAYCFFNDSYPRFQEALATINSGSSYSIAFSDKFALCIHETKGIVMYYKTELVGYIDGEGTPTLVPAKIHLQEQLDEVL